MPWGNPHTFVCVEPKCRKEFVSIAINPLRCPECRGAHNKARILDNYRKKRGALYGVRPDKNKPLSDAARFNLFMAKTWRYAKCPICGQHMSTCRCCEPVVRHVDPVRVETWKPWR